MILYARKISNIYAAADLADVYVAVFRVTATLADEHPRIERNILLLNFKALTMTFRHSSTSCRTSAPPST